MTGVSLFVYGSLLSETRLSAVTGRRFPRRPARLDGFERIQPAQGYPYLVPKPGCHVDGLLVDDIDAASLRKLDAYEDEGRLYLRQPVWVSVGDERVAAETYVGNVDAR